MKVTNFQSNQWGVHILWLICMHWTILSVYNRLSICFQSAFNLVYSMRILPTNVIDCASVKHFWFEIGFSSAGSTTAPIGSPPIPPFD